MLHKKVVNKFIATLSNLQGLDAIYAEESATLSTCTIVINNAYTNSLLIKQAAKYNNLYVVCSLYKNNYFVMLSECQILEC